MPLPSEPLNLLVFYVIIVSVLIRDFTHVDATLFRSGTVEIQPEHLDEFNDSIIEIIHRY